MRDTLHIGVVAMQGAFAEHVRALAARGARATEVRTRSQLDSVDAVVIPGGESTAIRLALARCGLLGPLRDRIVAGMPAFGTCAGMIVLADASQDDAPACLALLDVDVERNGFGSQVHSFEAPIQLADTTVPGVFIRAPRIVRAGEQVEVLGRLADGEPVVVRQGHLLATSCHPELTSDTTLHATFMSMVRASVG